MVVDNLAGKIAHLMVAKEQGYKEKREVTGILISLSRIHPK
jgi:hypothetical protein